MSQALPPSPVVANIHARVFIRHGMVTDLEVRTTSTHPTMVSRHITAGQMITNCITAGRGPANPSRMVPVPTRLTAVVRCHVCETWPFFPKTAFALLDTGFQQIQNPREQRSRCL
jgi:hypothetical protein